MNNSMLLKVAGWLFISLQAAMVWQGQRMVDSLDDLANAISDGRERMATLDSRQSAQAERISQLDERNKGADLALRALSAENRDLDRRVTKLESTP